MITRNSQHQPVARFNSKWETVELIVPSLNNSVHLSAAKAEEIAIELAHAAKIMRGEA